MAPVTLLIAEMVIINHLNGDSQQLSRIFLRPIIVSGKFERPLRLNFHKLRLQY